ncbi:MAG: lycopene cyclase domain-containing protein [Gammaproteobacteria bacterium]
MLDIQYVWMVWSVSFLVPWLVLFWSFPRYRKPMLWVSLFTMPFGLTEPLFVPEYWMPPSLFDLALRTGFDIESLIFCFGIGGVGVVLYNVLIGGIFASVSEGYKHSSRHRYHRFALAAPFVVFPPLYFLPLNPIYPAFMAMIIGSITTILCRPDLKTKTWAGGLIFMLYYWIFVEGLELLSPGYVYEVWNLSNLSGLMIYHTPLEELIFAFTFGMYWAGVYEHFTWRKTVVHFENRDSGTVR